MTETLLRIDSFSLERSRIDACHHEFVPTTFTARHQLAVLGCGFSAPSSLACLLVHAHFNLRESWILCGNVLPSILYLLINDDMVCLCMYFTTSRGFLLVKPLSTLFYGKNVICHIADFGSEGRVYPFNSLCSA